jgi:hypothetical protein
LNWKTLVAGTTAEILADIATAEAAVNAVLAAESVFSPNWTRSFGSLREYSKHSEEGFHWRIVLPSPSPPDWALPL